LRSYIFLYSQNEDIRYLLREKNSRYIKRDIYLTEYNGEKKQRKGNLEIMLFRALMLLEQY